MRLAFTLLVILFVLVMISSINISCAVRVHSTPTQTDGANNGQ